MSDAFDPYYIWLGIPPEDQPPHHYRLLGVTLFESNREVIEAAANRQMNYLQEISSGEENIDEAQKILGELSKARICLLNDEKKAAYDAELRASLDTLIEAPEETADEPLMPPQIGLPDHEAGTATEAPTIGQAKHRPHATGKSKKKQGLGPIIGLAVVLLVLLVGGMAFFLSSRAEKFERERTAEIVKKEKAAETERRTRADAEQKAKLEKEKNAKLQAERKAKQEAERKAAATKKLNAARSTLEKHNLIFTDGFWEPKMQWEKYRQRIDELDRLHTGIKNNHPIPKPQYANPLKKLRAEYDKKIQDEFNRLVAELWDDQRKVIVFYGDAKDKRFWELYPYQNKPMPNQPRASEADRQARFYRTAYSFPQYHKFFINPSPSSIRTSLNRLKELRKLITQQNKKLLNNPEINRALKDLDQSLRPAPNANAN